MVVYPAAAAKGQHCVRKRSASCLKRGESVRLNWTVRSRKRKRDD